VTSANLENLAKIGQLKKEPPDEDSEWRVLATCHERRNRAEYQGILEADERLLAALVEIGAQLLAALEAPKTKNR
jgi:hypothetical protein